MNPGQNLELELDGVRAEAGAAALEFNVRFTGRIAGIFGPSGSGKTTMIELIAGLRRPAAGRIRIGSQVVVDVSAGIWVAPRHRRVGLVPQDLALFPHLTARGNLLYGSRAAVHDSKPVEFDQVVGMLEIGGLLDRSVDQLSGGEKQRVALGRALLASPRLLLLDEPMASLDWPLKSRLLPCLARVRDELGLPMAYVSHDRREILALADELLVLDQGRVQQQGSVVEVFRRPANAAVAAQVTSETVLPCRVVDRGDGLVKLATGSATLLALDDGLPEPTTEVFACIRAEDVSVVVEPSPRISSRNRLAGVVRGLHAEGATVRVTIDCGFELTALLTRSGCETLVLRPGLEVVALIKAPQIHLIPR